RDLTVTGVQTCALPIFFCSVLAAQTLPAPTVNSTPAPATRKPLPDAPGKETFLRVCSQCHSAEIVIFYDRSEEQWSYTVHQMAEDRKSTRLNSSHSQIS